MWLTCTKSKKPVEQMRSQRAQFQCLRCNSVTTHTIVRRDPIYRYVVMPIYCKKCNMNREQIVLRIVPRRPLA